MRAGVWVFSRHGPFFTGPTAWRHLPWAHLGFLPLRSLPASCSGCSKPQYSWLRTSLYPDKDQVKEARLWHRSTQRPCPVGPGCRTAAAGWPRGTGRPPHCTVGCALDRETGWASRVSPGEEESLCWRHSRGAALPVRGKPHLPLRPESIFIHN